MSPAARALRWGVRMAVLILVALALAELMNVLFSGVPFNPAYN